jgi:hypothetical protein
MRRRLSLLGAQGAPIVVEVHDHGFHWGDAAVGAAGAFGLTLLSVAVVIAFRQFERRGS